MKICPLSPDRTNGSCSVSTQPSPCGITWELCDLAGYMYRTTAIVTCSIFVAWQYWVVISSLLFCSISGQFGSHIRNSRDGCTDPERVAVKDVVLKYACS